MLYSKKELMASIIVRAFEMSDVTLINEWRNDPEIQSTTGSTTRKVSSEMEKEWVRSKMMNNYNEIYWAICLNDETKRMVGYTSINNIDYINRTTEGGGTVIGDKESRDGIIYLEVALLKLDYIFNTLNLNRTTGKCATENKRTKDLLLSLNYEMEGRMRQVVYKNGVYHDVFIFSLLRDEYYRGLQNGDYEVSSVIKRYRAFQKSEE